MISLVQLATAEEVWELPIPAWAYGVITLALFLAALGLTWSFRNMAHTLMYGRDGRPVTSSGLGTRPEPGAKGHGTPAGGGH